MMGLTPNVKGGSIAPGLPRYGGIAKLLCPCNYYLVM